jgi:O-antigen/teichoic acid export membrane protein
MSGRKQEVASMPRGPEKSVAQRPLWRSPARVLSLASRVPLYRSSSALILTTGFNAGLGLVFWTLAARLYSVEEVGEGAAVVASLQLVSMLGCSGLTPALIALVPRSGSTTTHLVRWIYLAGVGIAITCGAGLLIATQLFIEPLAVPGIVYLVAIPIFVIFTLQDGALIGLRREGWVPAENAIYGVVKIVLLVAFSTGGAWGIFVSWSISAILLVVPINLLLFLKFIPEHGAREPPSGEEFNLAEVGRFAGGNHVSGLLMAVPDFLIPIIVLQIEGADKTAFFFAAWSLVWPLRLVGTNIANAFTAQAASDESGIGDLLYKGSLLILAIFVPLVLVLTLGSHPLLRYLFGPEYAANGDTLMRILAPGLLPFAFVALGVALARVRGQLSRLLALSAVYFAISLPLSVALISAIGINGAGIAWLLSQVFVGFLALAIWRLGLLNNGRRVEIPSGARMESEGFGP